MTTRTCILAAACIIRDDLVRLTSRDRPLGVRRRRAGARQRREAPRRAHGLVGGRRALGLVAQEAQAQSAGEDRRPQPDEREPDQLEPGEVDEPRGEHADGGGAHHDDRQRHDPQARGERPSCAHREAEHHDEREHRAAGGAIVQELVRVQGHQAHGAQMHAERADAEREHVASSAVGRVGDGQQLEPRADREAAEQHPRDDDGEVEDVTGQVGVGAELAEVQSPPVLVGRGQDGDGDPDREDGRGGGGQVLGTEALMTKRIDSAQP